MARIIREVMEEGFEEPVDPWSIPRKYANQLVYGKAICRGCQNCNNSWSTYLAWLTLDLRNQRIARRWKQKCLTCSKPNMLWFPPEELQSMVVIAVERVWKLLDGTFKRRGRQN